MAAPKKGGQVVLDLVWYLDLSKVNLIKSKPWQNQKDGLIPNKKQSTHAHFLRNHFIRKHQHVPKTVGHSSYSRELANTTFPDYDASIPLISVCSTQEAVIMDRRGLGRATAPPFRMLPAWSAGCFLICCTAGWRCGRF